MPKDGKATKNGVAIKNKMEDKVATKDGTPEGKNVAMPIDKPQIK